MEKKKKNSSKNKQTKRRKKPGKLRWQTLLQKKKKIKRFISLESNIQLEERNYFGCNFRISVHIFSFC